MKRNNMNVNNIPHVITAARILPNICEVHGEDFSDTWMQNMDGDYDQPETVPRDSHWTTTKCEKRIDRILSTKLVNNE